MLTHEEMREMVEAEIERVKRRIRAATDSTLMYWEGDLLILEWVLRKVLKP